MSVKTMITVIVFSLSAWPVISAETTAAQASPPRLAKISQHVYAYTGIVGASPTVNSIGANAGIVIGDDAVLVVDTLISARQAARFIDEIKAITDRPIKYVVNTHYHLDHAWGNCEFVKQGAVVIAHENVKEYMKTAAGTFANTAAYGLTPDIMEGTRLIAPDIHISGKTSINLGGVTVELRHHGNSHNNTSISAYVVEDKTLFAGDIIFNRYHPFMGECDIKGWCQALNSLADLRATAVIPGHGPLADYGDIVDMKAYLRSFDALAKELCVGKDVNDAQAIAEEMLKRLPDQKRSEMTYVVAKNLSLKYLPGKPSSPAPETAISAPPAPTSDAGGYLVVDLPNGQISEISEPSDLSEYKTGKLLMRRIPAGNFVMGVTREENELLFNAGGAAVWLGNTEPPHEVTLTKDFHIGVFEMTQAQWEAVMGTNPSFFKNAGKDAPVERVSWNDCQEFIKKLNAKTPGGGFRLPTEAEWEYACRAGTTTTLYTGGVTFKAKNNCPELDPIAWYSGNSGAEYAGAFNSTASNWEGKQYEHEKAGTHPVGLKKPNAWGLYDMLGNVEEWCSDGYSEYPYNHVSDPKGGAANAIPKIHRGGAWCHNAELCRAAARIAHGPTYRWFNIGFRLAWSPPSKTEKRK